jgi:hypothetical protein
MKIIFANLATGWIRNTFHERNRSWIAPENAGTMPAFPRMQDNLLQILVKEGNGTRHCGVEIDRQIVIVPHILVIFSCARHRLQLRVEGL